MRFTSLLIGTVASICTVYAAYRADTVIVPEPETTQYVSVCNAYGAGFFIFLAQKHACGFMVMFAPPTQGQ